MVSHNGIVYAKDLEPFEENLRQAGIPYNEKIKFITEGEHLHSTEPRFTDSFEQLCLRLGVEEAGALVRRCTSVVVIGERLARRAAEPNHRCRTRAP